MTAPKNTAPPIAEPCTCPVVVVTRPTPGKSVGRRCGRLTTSINAQGVWVCDRHSDEAANRPGTNPPTPETSTMPRTLKDHTERNLKFQTEYLDEAVQKVENTLRRVADDLARERESKRISYVDYASDVVNAIANLAPSLRLDIVIRAGGEAEAARRVLEALTEMEAS